MKNNFIPHQLCFLLILVVFCFLPKKADAQTLEEIPNPTDFTLSWFSGGEDGNLFFEYYDPTFYTEMFHYDGNNLSMVPFDQELSFSFYSHEFNGNFYFIGYDINFNQKLMEYNGIIASEIALPTGTQFGNFIAEYDDKMYVYLWDINFNSLFYEYDGTTFTEVGTPSGLTFGSFVSVFDGIMYLSFYDINFNNQLMAYDATTFTPIAIPTGVQYSFFAGETDTQMFLSFYDQATFQSILFTFDGTTLTEISNPTGFQFSWIMNLDDDISYLNYYDINFNNFVFKLEDNILTALPTPVGFQFPNFITNFDGKDFFSFYDVNFNQFLFSYDGTDFVEVDAPTGLTFSQFAGEVTEKAFFVYYDLNFNTVFTVLESGSNSVTELPGPPDFTYNSFVTTLDDKIFLSFYDVSFTQTIFIFDGDEFTEVVNPLGKQYGFFMVEDGGALYLRYNDLNYYEGTLYKLRPNSIPTSADNSVETLINIPYFFSADDFAFADSDGDTLASIMITEIEHIGNLFNDGAHVYPGDIISISDLSKLVFFPNTDEQGLNYDWFKFRVGDGDDFSEVEYLMNINVVEVLANNHIFLDANILLFPVPVDNFLTLQINATQALEDLNLRVIALNGQIVFQNNFQNLMEEFQQTIDVSQLPSGEYILHGTTPHGIIAKKFVK